MQPSLHLPRAAVPIIERPPEELTAPLAYSALILNMAGGGEGLSLKEEQSKVRATRL